MKKINLCIAALAATVGIGITPATAQDSATTSLERAASIEHAGGPVKVASARLGDSQHYIVYTQSRSNCAPGGCDPEVWQRNGSNWSKVGELPASGLPIVQLPGNDRGLPRLAITRYSVGSNSSLVPVSFNGRDYVEASGSTSGGKVLIAENALRDIQFSAAEIGSEATREQAEFIASLQPYASRSLSSAQQIPNGPDRRIDPKEDPWKIVTQQDMTAATMIETNRAPNFSLSTKLDFDGDGTDDTVRMYNNSEQGAIVVTYGGRNTREVVYKQDITFGDAQQVFAAGNRIILASPGGTPVAIVHKQGGSKAYAFAN